ncbi:hypothetical protein EVC14_007 [Rhizobium phage RHph_I3_18]|nr:hypothetical protein EVC14_007 [Rhizobium phage RHph_I3_18]
MSDEAAVAAPSGVAIDAPTPHTPELGSQIPQREQPAAPQEPTAQVKPDAKAEVSKTAGDAVRRANEALKAKEAEAAKAKDEKPAAKVEPKAEAKPERDRADDGKFKAKESADPKSAEQRTAQEQAAGNQTSEGRKPHHDAPARFNDFGKRDWANTPDSVKEETHRALHEMEEGHKKYKESAERYEKLREFDDLARKNGREGVHESLKEVIEIENAFTRNPIEGFKKIADHFGVNLQAVAAHIMGQNPNQQVEEANRTIQELRGEISRMKEEARAPQIVQEFFTAHEDAQDMADDMAFVLKQGIVGDLEAAYEYVKRFKPASDAGKTSQPLIPAESAPAHTQAPALNPAGSKSVSGAPSGGVSPASKRPVPSSTREALERASARLAT